MSKYLVTYHECYSRDYEVEANSKEEAEEIVKNDIFEGRREAPDNCYDSGCETEEIDCNTKEYDVTIICSDIRHIIANSPEEAERLAREKF